MVYGLYYNNDSQQKSISVSCFGNSKGENNSEEEGMADGKAFTGRTISISLALKMDFT